MTTSRTRTKPATKKPVARAREASPARPSRAASLTGDVVISGAVGRRRTGAQAIAPDHSPVAGSRAHRTLAPASAAPATPLAPADTLREVEQFLYRQSELLDGKAWQDYIDLFADDGLYWMPVSRDQTDWESWPSIFIEDKAMMQIRMGRVMHPNAWSQAPLWATSHVVGNVTIESIADDGIVARSRFHMMELRRDEIRHFGGTYRHTLVRTKAGLRIRMQRVDLFNAQAPFDYVLQVWV